MRDQLTQEQAGLVRPPALSPGPAVDTGGQPAHAAVLQLQRQVGNEAVSSLLEQERSPVLDVVGRGGGSSLSLGTRTAMESALGADFGAVRVHAGEPAAASARSVQAHAYTVGEEVVLGAGVDPESPAGQRTLAHELTHVVQQRAGDVDGTPTGDGIRVSDPGDRFEQEAERVADRVTSGPAAPAADPGVQREALDEDHPEEEPVQTQSVQRAEANEEVDEEPPPT